MIFHKTVKLQCPKCGTKFKPHEDSGGDAGTLCADCWRDLKYRALREGFMNLIRMVVKHCEGGQTEGSIIKARRE